MKVDRTDFDAHDEHAIFGVRRGMARRDCQRVHRGMAAHKPQMVSTNREGQVKCFDDGEIHAGSRETGATGGHQMREGFGVDAGGRECITSGRDGELASMSIVRLHPLRSPWNPWPTRFPRTANSIEGDRAVGFKDGAVSLLDAYPGMQPCQHLSGDFGRREKIGDLQ